jgi:hypothetical protein
MPWLEPLLRDALVAYFVKLNFSAAMRCIEIIHEQLDASHESRAHMLPEYIHKKIVSYMKNIINDQLFCKK